MKWRESQVQPASPAPDATFSLVSPQTQTESSPGSGSDLYDKGTPADSNEAISSPGGSSSPTPRPSSKQALAHVLIVDDNEINVKVLSQAASEVRSEHH
jgi:hypothetical protein